LAEYVATMVPAIAVTENVSEDDRDDGDGDGE
jgi:hypothetical protein